MKSRLIVTLNVSDAAFLVASYRRNKFVQECSDMMSITASVLARRSTMDHHAVIG